MKNHMNYCRFAAIFTAALLTLVATFANAQGTAEKKPTIALVDFDCTGYNINAQQVKYYVINELIRTQKYEVMDRYEIDYISKRDTLNPVGCFSKPCLTAYGQKLNADYMFTGDIIKIGDNINVGLRLLNVKNGSFEKMIVKEFLLIPGSELMMIRITLNEIFGLPNDAETVRKLTEKAEFDDAINNPYKLRLRTDGPRMGFTFFTGLTSDVMLEKKDKGGFESAYPAMFQFGYQFEKQYLNEGNLQALFEIIPNISGLDQGRFIPSLTFLNGLRNNRNGWEFGIGPNFSFAKMAKGFYTDPNDKKTWTLEINRDPQKNPEETFPVLSRPDSRGDITLITGLLIGVGKTFKSGRMNIPMNFFMIPGKNGFRFGVSFGWNGKDRYEKVGDN